MLIPVSDLFGVGGRQRLAKVPLGAAYVQRVRPRQPAEARSSTAHTRLMALVSPGESANDLGASLGLPKGALNEIRVSNAPMVFDWKPRIGGQPCFVGEQDPHSRRVEVAVFGGERLDPLVDDLD